MKTTPSARSRQLTGILLLGSALLLGASAVSKAADEPQPKDLRLFYTKNCVGCHGADGTARDAAGKSLRGQDFTDARWGKGASDEEMVKVIQKGKFFGLAMPAFKSALTKEEVQRMVTEIVRKCEKGKIIQSEAKTAGPAQ